MVDYYVNKLDPTRIGYLKINMGTWTLREGYKQAVTKNPELSHEIHFLQEINLQDFQKEWFPEHFRDQHWRMYNFAVVDLLLDKLIFRARLGIDLVKRMGW
mgnify:CR=1 FL=1